MNYQTVDRTKKEEVTELFRVVFAGSEGEEEGALIGNLSSELAADIDNEDIICFGAYEGEAIAGAIFFTRLSFTNPIKVYVLAPVAVRTDMQGRGVGQALIRYGLDELKKLSVDVAVTYGDPSFYSKVGFEPLSESVIQAPLTLSMPFGWLGQALTGGTIPTINERPLCVKAFDNPAYW